MKTFKSTIERFFKDYEQTFQDAIKGKKVDAKKVSACYTESFIQAGPKGIMVVQNDKKFLASIPKSYEFYNQLGAQAMKIGEQTITVLDELHAMVKIHWLSEYLKKDGKKVSIDYDIHYFLQLIGDLPKIFSFVTGDEEKMIKDSGLMPDRQ